MKSNFALFVCGSVTERPNPACSSAAGLTLKKLLLSYTSTPVCVRLPIEAIPVVPLGANMVRPAPTLIVFIPETVIKPDPFSPSKVFAGIEIVANPT